MRLTQDSEVMHAMVALGANLPVGTQSPLDTLRLAARRLPRPGVAVVAMSRLYRTPCFPPGAGPDYVNAAALLRLDGSLSPEALLAHLHAIEAEFGRQRDVRWGMRTLDIDLLAVGALVLPDADTADRWRMLPAAAQASRAPDRLILPHPRLQDRAFVLVPLADVAPDWVHPRTGQSVAAMLAALPQADRDAVVPLEPG